MRRFALFVFILAFVFAISVSVNAEELESESEMEGISTFSEVSYSEYDDFYFIMQPVNFFGEAGETASFSVLVNLSDVTYQWQYRHFNSVSWSNSSLPGNKTNTLTPTVPSVKNNYFYRCIVTDSSGRSIASDPALIFLDESSRYETIQAFGLIATTLGTALGWFQYLLNGAHLQGVYLAVFFILLVVRFLLAPLLGAARFAGASDIVRSSRERNRYLGSRERNNRGKFLNKGS